MTPKENTIRLAIRGFAGTELKFEDHHLPDLATKHANALAAHELHMIEVEFMDEPDPLEKFFRFGTDPSRMVSPIRV